MTALSLIELHHVTGGYWVGTVRPGPRVPVYPYASNRMGDIIAAPTPLKELSQQILNSRGRIPDSAKGYAPEVLNGRFTGRRITF
jgi:hypothetical protein